MEGSRERERGMYLGGEVESSVGDVNVPYDEDEERHCCGIGEWTLG